MALALETRQKHSVNLRSISVAWIHYALLLVCLSEVTDEYMNTMPRFLLQIGPSGGPAVVSDHLAIAPAYSVDLLIVGIAGTFPLPATS